jgi:hypothetical protein
VWVCVSSVIFGSAVVRAAVRPFHCPFHNSAQHIKAKKGKEEGRKEGREGTHSTGRIPPPYIHESKARQSNCTHARTYLAVSSATALPCPRKSARTSMPSSAHTVESTSNATAWWLLLFFLLIWGRGLDGLD